MKKCKKLTALLMAGVMGLSLFGCSSGKDAPTTVLDLFLSLIFL